ncbi:hypothetical protein DICPUDRAFT_27726 [Dictyostelium purpureum]|uniref:Pleckstrin domain-containing protein n=1 Tax=Dictyostelium purpureum TaxID=5786 RepID=F0ZAM1_DICPU|nr:uncharacterized protein DICPUDRAFT_27726 [Dictyostelium purpureum]EGC39000.1 hypothetical protein DICPUDRAFT_27726 [Dictyostelium purpureum]|eukprot:XP_003284453.1 hypothetical protein DICPUDRAFT_27726 [Dictyostelium purpureum]
MFSNFFGSSSKRNTIATQQSSKSNSNGNNSTTNNKQTQDDKPTSNSLPKSIQLNNSNGNNFLTSPSNSSPPSLRNSSNNSFTISPSSSFSGISSSSFLTTQHQGVITSLQMKPSCTNLTDDVENKKKQKYDPTLEQTARKWVSDVLEIGELDPEVSFFEHFKSGVLLCKLVNKLKPGVVKKINESTISFKQLENIENYLKACTHLGLQSVNLFNSIDLFENKDITLVIRNIVVLGKHAAKIETYTGIHLAGEKKNIKITTTPVSPLFSANNSINSNNNNSLNNSLSPNRNNISPPSTISNSSSNVLSKSTNGQKKAKWRKSVKIPAVSSLNSDIRTKEAFKYSPELQKSAQDWIEEVTNEKFKLPFASSLKDGILLCKIINIIIPKTILFINNGNSSFKKMENIGHYLNGCLAVGLKKTDLFDTPDLFEEKNINLVISNIHVLANHVSKFHSHLKLPSIKKDSGLNHTNSPLKLYSSIIHSRFGNTTSTVTQSQIEDAQDLMDWINGHLKAYHHLQVRDIGSDLCNGVTLLTLLEEITQQKVGIFTKEPVLPWHFMQNICLLLNFLRDNSVHSVSELSPHDLFNGDCSSICKVVRLIRDHFDRDHLFKSIPMDTRRQKVIEEIISTEQSYVKSLGTVYNSLIIPLHNSLDTLNPILTKDEIFSIFGNWEILLRSHVSLLNEFKSKLQLNNDIENLTNIVFNSNITIGDLFLEKCEFLKDNYANYINNYDNSYQRIKRLRKGNSIFDEIVNTFEIFQDSNNGLDLYSYLIMPIQRIPRYLLLLKELIKYTPMNHPDYQMLINAKENIKRVADHVNESKMVVENKRKISSIQESISQIPFNLMDKERTYIREGFLEIEDTFKKDSYFFLFSDILLYVKYKPSEETGKEFKFKEIFYLDQVVDVSDILSEDEECIDENSSINGNIGSGGEFTSGDEDQYLRKSCNSNSNNSNSNRSGNTPNSNSSEPKYSFEIETNDFCLTLLAESHNEKIDWMEDLRSCLQHQLIKDEDQLSDLSIISEDEDGDQSSNLNSINSPVFSNNSNNNESCKLEVKFNNNLNINGEEFEQDQQDQDQLEEDYDENSNISYSEEEEEEEINQDDTFDGNDLHKIKNIDGFKKVHRRLESEDTISDTESEELRILRKKKLPISSSKRISFSEKVQTIDR